MNEDESAFSGDRSRFEGATIWLHEASHAAHYLTRWPEKILEVQIGKAELGYLKAEPLLVHGVELEDLGCGMLVQYLAGSLGERIGAGERQIVSGLNLVGAHWIEHLTNTPFGSDVDRFAAQAVLAAHPDLDMNELRSELETAEGLIRDYLPKVDLKRMEELYRSHGMVRMINRYETLH